MSQFNTPSSRRSQSSFSPIVINQIDIIKSGFLTKESSILRSKRHRWCILTKHKKLYTFEKQQNDNNFNPKDCTEKFNLTEYKNIIAIKNSNEFTLSSAKKKRKFIANSVQERDEWHWDIKNVQTGNIANDVNNYLNDNIIHTPKTITVVDKLNINLSPLNDHKSNDNKKTETETSMETETQKRFHSTSQIALKPTSQISINTVFDTPITEPSHTPFKMLQSRSVSTDHELKDTSIVDCEHVKSDNMMQLMSDVESKYAINESENIGMKNVIDSEIQSYYKCIDQLISDVYPNKSINYIQNKRCELVSSIPREMFISELTEKYGVKSMEKADLCYNKLSG
eukprot:447439_1